MRAFVTIIRNIQVSNCVTVQLCFYVYSEIRWVIAVNLRIESSKKRNVRKLEEGEIKGDKFETLIEEGVRFAIGLVYFEMQRDSSITKQS